MLRINILPYLTEINLLDAKIRNKKLVNESDISGFLNDNDLNEKIKTARKVELKAVQNKILKLQAYDLSLFVGQSFFFNDGAQNY